VASRQRAHRHLGGGGGRRDRGHRSKSAPHLEEYDPGALTSDR
jgi:hypothetical protein